MNALVLTNFVKMDRMKQIKEKIYRKGIFVWDHCLILKMPFQVLFGDGGSDGGSGGGGDDGVGEFFWDRRSNLSATL